MASGADDGAAIAVAPENLTAAQAPYVVGQAWEAKSATVLGLVNVAILPIDHSAALASENAELKKEIEEIKLQIQEIKAWMSDKKGRKSRVLCALIISSLLLLLFSPWPLVPWLMSLDPTTPLLCPMRDIIGMVGMHNLQLRWALKLALW